MGSVPYSYVNGPPVSASVIYLYKPLAPDLSIKKQKMKKNIDFKVLFCDFFMSFYL
jgi:hypothetical protein